MRRFDRITGNNTTLLIIILIRNHEGSLVDWLGPDLHEIYFKKEKFGVT